ncbi:MAG: phage replisome organizer N-terminal domain-containing protein [Lachnospiraceae bacterium]|nr:phage replisome organizer N-terminal domain-containing protein [Lachnospiraceae bacterium]
MSDSKQYYYIRLKEDFFREDAVIALESLDNPDGFRYSNIYLKMLLRSLRNDGKLMVSDVIPYNPTMLSTLTGHPVAIVEKALYYMENLGLIERLDNGAVYMLNIQTYIGRSSSEADRKKAYRDRIELEKNGLKNALLKHKKEVPDLGQMSGQMSGQISTKDADKIPPEYRDKSIEIRDIELSSDNSICSEPSKKAHKQKAEEPLADVEAIILNNGSEWRPTVSQLEEYKRLYPGVDVVQEFRNMRGWCSSNPSRRKTKAGIKRFVTNWLSKEQNRGGRPSRSRDTRYMTTDEYMQATAGWYTDDEETV